MGFLPFPTPHCHSSSSLDTASTPEKFAAWEVAHETGYLTVTDHGTLAGARQIYDLCTGKKYKGKLTPIPGLEAYFRDDDCPILLGGGIERSKPNDKGEGGGKLDEYLKYFHLTMHFLDQEAYETCVRILSRADARAEQHGKERKPLFGWQDLEELGSKNITFGSGCLIGMIQRHLAFGNRPDLAEAYYRRLRSIVKPGNFFVEAFPHICDSNWDSAVVLTFEDGTSEKFKIWKNLKTDKKYSKTKAGADREGIKAEYLVDHWAKDQQGHGSLRAVMESRKWVEREPKVIKDVKLVEGFIQNDCSPFSPNGDLQLPCNRWVVDLARRLGDPVLISDDSHFAVSDEKVVQDIKLRQSGNWRFANSYHRMTSDDAWVYFRDVMGVPKGEFEGWIDNGRSWASRFKGLKLLPHKSLPTSFYPQNTLEHTMELVQRQGRMRWDDPVRLDRLKQEVDLLHYNGIIDLLPYFFIDEEVCSLYERWGELTGPGRGSAAGLLLAYLEGITHVDPLRYGLSKDRFLTVDRVQSGKLPDIDQDLPHRDLLVSQDVVEEDDEEEGGEVKPGRGWLEKRFGDCVVQISTDITLKLRAAVLDVARIMSPNRQVPPAIAKLTAQFAKPPMGISDKDFVFGYLDNGVQVPGSLTYDEALVEYVAKYPDQWEVAQKCLGLVKTKGRHPCSYLISDEPVSNFIPTTSISGFRVTQPTAAQVESSGGLKMDFLVVNSIKDIGAAIRLIQAGDRSLDWEAPGRLRQRLLAGDGGAEVEPVPSTQINGLRVPLIRVVPHGGQHLDIWDLPEDQAVFRSICEGDTESVFQFGTPGAVKWLRHFNHIRLTEPDGTVHKAIDSIESLAAFTALDRPGPLDAKVGDGAEEHNMLVEYARRARGEPAIGNFPILDQLFPETYGVIVYQEQVQRAFHEVGGTTAIQANDFRIHVSKKQPMEIMKDRDLFMPGATQRIGQEAAEQLWESMRTFGEYAFNKSHAVCYVVISYACAFLKHHYPVEWWTAVLQHAKKKEIAEKFWPHCGHLIDMPDLGLSGETFEIVSGRIRAPISLLHGVGPKAHQEMCEYRPILSVEDLCQKVEARKQRTSHRVERVDKKTGATKVSRSKGRSSLNFKTMKALTITGALSSLFPPDTDTLVQLEEFIQTEARISGDCNKAGKPKKRVPSGLKILSALGRYQLKKVLLPPYSEDLFPYCEGKLPKLQLVTTLSPVDGRPMKKWVYDLDDRHTYTVVKAFGLRAFEQDVLNPSDTPMCVAAVAYCYQYERRATTSEDGTVKEKVQVGLDVEGARWSLVKWGDWDTGKLEAKFHRDWKGSIVLALLSKREGKRYRLDDMVLVQPELDVAGLEEDSPPGEEEE